MTNRKTYIFDLCGTLYFSNTTFDFITWYHCKYSQPKYWLLKFLLSPPFKVIWYVLYKFQIKVPLRYWLIRTLKGTEKITLQNEAIEFVENFLEIKKNHQIHSTLSEALNKNLNVILISASLDIVAAAVAKRLKINNYIASQLEFDNEDNCTGLLNEDIQGKKLEKLKHILELSLNESAVYTDNLEDLPLIKVCDKAVIISKKSKIRVWEQLLKGHRDSKILRI